MGSCGSRSHDARHDHRFRIPALAAHSDKVFAFAEGRVRQGRAAPIPCTGSPNASCCYGALANCCDNRCLDKDIVVKVSTTGGRSWGRSARLTSSNREALYTNPTALADAQTGRVWVLYQRCNSTAPVPYAACTNVLRWTDAADLTEGAAVRWSAEIFPSDPAIYASVMGPGAGLQLRRGPHAGRLLFQGSHCLYSDDGGQHWTWSGPSGVGESGAAELSDGAVVLAGGEPPNHNDPYFHLSTDSGSSWAAQVHDRSVTQGQAQGQGGGAGGRRLTHACLPQICTRGR